MPKSFSFWDHPIEALEKALDLRKQIEALRKTVADIMGGQETGHGKVAKRRGRPANTAPVTAKVDGRKGKRSAATRAKMAAAAKARWAAKKGGLSHPAPGVVVIPSRKRKVMSPEARARIAVAQRARWAKVKK